MTLSQFVLDAAVRQPDALAVCAPDGTATYAELDGLANQLARALQDVGVRKGDRVGIWAAKSVESVATQQAVLRLGAAYVPIDQWIPVIRASAILDDCAVAALVSSSSHLPDLPMLAGRPVLLLDRLSDPVPYLSRADLERYARTPVEAPAVGSDDLAFVLYTSGSTGAPKGVCISQGNALAFVEWAVKEVGMTAADAVSNHAAFNFDLSVFDLYASFAVGASVHLVPEGLAYAPERLADFAHEHSISVWYSVPSVLMLMTDTGSLERRPLETLRAVLFAGEPFPTKHLRRLRAQLPQARLLNLYGPTETNVCTFYEVTTDPLATDEPIPIGRACSGDRVWARKDDGAVAGPGEEGELMVEGPTVMLGYWGRPPQNGAPYATGDWTRLREDGSYLYLGRRDYMVKVRGNRVELGEIEAALLAHPSISSAAVVVTGGGLEAHLVAFLAGVSGERPTFLALKRHSAERLPRYMIPDDFRFLPSLPLTRNGKVDRVALKALAEGQG